MVAVIRLLNCLFGQSGISVASDSGFETVCIYRSIPDVHFAMKIWCFCNNDSWYTLGASAIVMPVRAHLYDGCSPSRSLVQSDGDVDSIGDLVPSYEWCVVAPLPRPVSKIYAHILGSSTWKHPNDLLHSSQNTLRFR